jgi:sulfate permease, SulP family
VLIVSPRVLKRVPGPLVALVVATGLQATFQFSGVSTIGTAFGGIPQALPSFAWPDMTFTDIVTLIGPAFTIALLGAIESLLSAVVADGMAGTRHDSNQELIGQGVANIASPLFGGFASTGAIARTATNIRNGAVSPVAGIVHAAVLVLIVLLAAPLASYIPLAVLAAILFVVAYNMSEAHHFLHLARTSPKADVAVLLITFSLTVFADLVIAVNVCVVIASLLFMRRMAIAVQIQEHSDALDAAGQGAGGMAGVVLPANTMVYSIDGPFFFGAAEKLETTLESIQSHMETVVLRMGRVPFVDATGIQALSEMAEDFKRHKTRLVLCEIRPNVEKKLQRARLFEKIDPSNVFPDLAGFAASMRPTIAAAAPQPAFLPTQQRTQE